MAANVAARTARQSGACFGIDGDRLTFDATDAQRGFASGCALVLATGSPRFFAVGPGVEVHIRRVLDGIVVFLTDSAARRCLASREALKMIHGLTASEAEVTQCLLDGAEPREIAMRLSISTHTVRAHLRSIFAKTATRSQAGLTRLLLSGVAALTGAHPSAHGEIPQMNDASGKRLPKNAHTHANDG